MSETKTIEAQERESQKADAAARLVAMQGELERVSAERDGLKGRVAELEQQLAAASSNGGDAVMTPLARDALKGDEIQLCESITVSLAPPGRRAAARSGDVLLAGSEKRAEELQKKLGTKHRVHRVSKDVLAGVREQYARR